MASSGIVASSTLVCSEPVITPGPPLGQDVFLGTDGKNPIFDAIRFDYNAYDIKHYFENEALKVADYLKNNKNKAVMLYGNTDDKGNTDYNKKLAEKRVDAVRNYLVKHGINNNRIKSFSYGEHRSVYSNKTPEGRLKNRRVDFEIKDYPWQD